MQGQAVRQAGPALRRHVGHKHAELAVLDPARGAGVLPLDTDGLGALLDKIKDRLSEACQSPMAKSDRCRSGCLDHSRSARHDGVLVVYSLHVHLVFTPKHRRGPFTSEILRRCEEIMRDVCADFGADPHPAAARRWRSSTTTSSSKDDRHNEGDAIPPRPETEGPEFLAKYC